MGRRLSSETLALREQAPPYRVAAAGRPPLTRLADTLSAIGGEGRVRGPLTCLDLFCGCGGFTLGMQRAGFHVLAAIDSNPEAIATLRANLVERRHPDLLPVAHALERDLTRFHPEELAALLRDSPARPLIPSFSPGGGEGARRAVEGATPTVDVIVGGPPCQGFSLARRRDGANHGQRLKPDPRRQLYREFLRFVDYFQPRVFVMENVPGLRTSADGKYFTRVQQEARELGRAQGRPGYRVHGQIEDAWELGVPQKRRRQLIIGVRADLPGYFPSGLKPAPRAEPQPVLGTAIGDLPILRAGGGEDERDYDLARRCDHVDFALLKEGENSAVAMRERGVRFAFPYDKTKFRDRYTKQCRWQPCSTIVAHLSKDGLMFIHPTQNRSLTPREAARQAVPPCRNPS